MYYIDNVQYGYNLGAAPMTTFSVIRGVPLPTSLSTLAVLLASWDVRPIGLQLADGDPTS